VGQLGPGPEHCLAASAPTPDLVQTGHARETMNEVMVGWLVGWLVVCTYLLPTQSISILFLGSTSKHVNQTIKKLSTPRFFIV
jgi:hypothetical protein